MEFRKLEVFCKVVELKSFTKTGEAMLLSQPTVSEHIRNLEQELGHKLIDRLGREVEPTPVGRLLYSYAVKILRLRQETLQVIEQYSGRLSGQILLGASTIPGTYILPKMLGPFHQQHQEIKVVLHISDSRDIARKVGAGDFDIGLIGAVWNERSLDWTPTFGDHLVVAMHPENPLARQDTLSMADIVKEPFILREQGSGTRKVITQILERHGYKEAQLNDIATIGSPVAVKEAIKAATGISILSHHSIAEDAANGKVTTVPLKGVETNRSFYCIRRKNRALSPVASVFMDYLLSEAQQGKQA